MSGRPARNTNDYILDVGTASDDEDDNANQSHSAKAGTGGAASLEFTNYAMTSAAIPARSGQKMSSASASASSPAIGPSNTVPSPTKSPPVFVPNAESIPSSAAAQFAINEQATGKQTIWSLAFYQQFFDIDLMQVLQRMYLSAVPLSGFLQTYRDSPDIYGPFWITTTVIFQVFVTRSIQKSLEAYMNDTPFLYDFAILPGAALFLYAYMSAWPLLLWALIRYCLRFPAVQFLDLLGLYGYSLSVWIAVLLLVMIPGQTVQYIACVTGLLLNGIFVLRNYPALFAGSGQEASFSMRTKQLSAGSIVVLIVLGSKIALACTVKYWFLA